MIHGCISIIFWKKKLKMEILFFAEIERTRSETLKNEVSFSRSRPQAEKKWDFRVISWEIAPPCYDGGRQQGGGGFSTEYPWYLVEMKGNT